MTPEQFAYWLQGFSEINQDTPTPQQWKVIKDHLGLVFNKVTPNYDSRQNEAKLPSPNPLEDWRRKMDEDMKRTAREGQGTIRGPFCGVAQDQGFSFGEGL